MTERVRWVGVLGALILTTSQAAAADLLLYEGDARAAFDGAAADLGVEPWALVPARVEERTMGLSPRLDGVQPALCSVRVRNADLRPAVSTAEGLVDYRRLPEAARALADAHLQLACLVEPAEASLAGRVAFLQGVVHALSGHAADATAAYAEALAWQPDLRWQDEFDPATRPPFDAAVAARASGALIPLTLGPGAEDPSSLWIDGHRPATTGGALALPAGHHLVQILGGATTWTAAVDLAPGVSAVLVNPAGLVTADLARALAAPDPAPWARALRGLALGESNVYLRVDGTTWRVEDDRFTRVARRAARADGPPCPVASRCVGAGLIGGGVAGIVLGGGALAWGELSAAAHASDGEDFEALDVGPDVLGTRSILVDAYYEQFEASQAERHLIGAVGAGVAGVGAVAVVTGIVLQHLPAQTPAQRATVVPQVLPGGAALAVTGRW